MPVLFDENESTDKREVEKKLPEGVRAEVITGSLPEQVANETQLLVLSPGVPVDTPFVERFRDKGVRVLSLIHI